MTSKTVLEVKALQKSFSKVQAVSDLSFSLDEGDIFAFLGPNGAGKTTTLRMLLDIIKPDSGSIEWILKGMTSGKPAAGLIGYLPEERGLYLDIPIIKSLVYLASIRGMDPSAARTAGYEWLERLDLSDRANDKLQALSKGNQQKIQFVASILHKPVFAILDEPFSGFDPVNQEKFIGYIREINAQGTTVLLSAHQMALVEKLANKIFLINDGREVFKGELSEIYQSFGRKMIIDLFFESTIPEIHLENNKDIESAIRIDEMAIRVIFRNNVNLNQALTAIGNIEGVVSIKSHKPDLHEIFLNLIKDHQQ